MRTAEASNPLSERSSFVHRIGGGAAYMVTGFVLAYVFLLRMGVHGELRLAASWVCGTMWHIGYQLGVR